MVLRTKGEARRSARRRNHRSLVQFVAPTFLVAILISYLISIACVTNLPTTGKSFVSSIENRSSEGIDTISKQGEADRLGARTFVESSKRESIDPVSNQGGAKISGESRKDLTKLDLTLKAFLEPIDFSDWQVKPLPNRSTARTTNLKEIQYPELQSCSNFAAQFPIDNFPDEDSFLPWIHDVFPSHNGNYIQIVAQNKRRCNTGSKDDEILAHMQPQAALFQHVAVKRIIIDGETRYQLTDHQDADSDGIDTRFICRFKPSMQETLSTFDVNYDYVAFRKAYPRTFSQEGRGDIKTIFTSQLLFRCPVPSDLQETVRLGSSVNDFGTLFLDIIPMRTPPRYGPPNIFLPPEYDEFRDKVSPFNTTEEWGNHVLPRIGESGRWENIPICKPSLQQYGRLDAIEKPKGEEDANHDPIKRHRLAACTWTSTDYHTRGNRFQVSDGLRRLHEWVHFHLMVGFEHFYIYDNSGAHNKSSSLQPIADMFPDTVTIVNWSAKVCNNRPYSSDSPGERSSQYAADSSCRLRFGAYTDWLGSFDVDEYIVPMGQDMSLLPLLDKLDKEEMKIISFLSSRSSPRRELIDKPVKLEGRRYCKSKLACFKVNVPWDRTILQAYNCDRFQGSKLKYSPAEKQIYKPEYVQLHFVHYSTATKLTAANREEYAKLTDVRWKKKMASDPFGRFSDEINEATMLHSKAVAMPDTAGWELSCKGLDNNTCLIGIVYPGDMNKSGHTVDSNDWRYNCYVNEKVERVFVPFLEAAMKSTSKAYNTLGL